MKSILFTMALGLLFSASAHASDLLADCQVLAVEDGQIPLMTGDGIRITDAGAIIGSTIYRNATITEQTSGTMKAVRVIDRQTTIEVISDIRTGDGTLYVTQGSGPTREAAKLLCR